MAINPASPNRPDKLPRTTDPGHQNSDFTQDKKPAGFPPPSKDSPDRLPKKQPNES
jgi:hypothetical protein